MEQITKVTHTLKQWNWDSNPGLTLDPMVLGPLIVKFYPPLTLDPQDKG